MRGVVSCGLAALAIGFLVQPTMAADLSGTLSNPSSTMSARAQPPSLKGTSGFAALSGQSNPGYSVEHGGSISAGAPLTTYSNQGRVHQTLSAK